ncbi:M23 family metallopeptidase [Emticicia sp. BO119]|uniref:M23 family metallopeptidase n=1 Tax=Emticicia sp. BO119 TaxID=2757768 RepID=UPI0015F04DD1|nr:M23 family metallopeptidase [Emticicia sp. BO119]MBA4849013.1 M23 family metallopeptidase [Emticicia sp. BO119]
MKKRDKNLLIAGAVGIVLGGVGMSLAGTNDIVSPLKIRVDGEGDGNFGTSRLPPYNKHYGLDLEVKTGQRVYAPFSGTIILIPKALKDKDGYQGVRIMADNGLKIDVLYIKPAVKANTRIKKGDLIGYAQDITKAYSDTMKNHIHIEHFDPKTLTFLNPTSYYFGSSVVGSISEFSFQVSPEFYANYVAHQGE